MGIPQRMAVGVSSLVFAGATLVTTGTVAQANAASPGAFSVNAASARVETGTAQLMLSSRSWCSRHPWKCHNFRHHHKFRHHRHGHGGWGGWGGWGRGDGGWGQSVSVHNSNINISSSSSSQFQGYGW